VAGVLYGEEFVQLFREAVDVVAEEGTSEGRGVVTTGIS